MSTLVTSFDAADIPPATSHGGSNRSTFVSATYSSRPQRTWYQRYAIGVFKTVVYPAVVLFVLVDVAANGISRANDTAKITAREHLRRYRIRHGKLPKSKPLGVIRTKSGKSGRSQNSAFLCLPLEIRLRIYELVLPTKVIFQPMPGHWSTRTHGLYSEWGPRRADWSAGQCIRSDEEPPSAVLRTTIGLGGSYLRQCPAAPSHGFVRYQGIWKLICGDQWMEFGYSAGRKPCEAVFVTDLMRACRATYVELLDVLYGDNTISFFGAESLLFFARNVSPEGLQRIRHVHLAIFISSKDWESPSRKRFIMKAIGCLQDSFNILTNLDIEVVLVWGQPVNGQLFWKWLKDDLLSPLRVTGNFVLKVSVYRPLEREEYWRYGYEDWTPDIEPISSWDTDEYLALKAVVVNPESTDNPK